MTSTEIANLKLECLKIAIDKAPSIDKAIERASKIYLFLTGQL